MPEIPRCPARFHINAVDTHNVYGNLVDWIWRYTIVRVRLSAFPDAVRPFVVSGADLLVWADLIASDPENLCLTDWQVPDEDNETEDA
jgi:hypothetical protein